MQMQPTAAESAVALDDGAVPLLMAAELQDHLMVASNDLERLQRLLADTCDTLMAQFGSALGAINAAAAVGVSQLDTARSKLSEAVTALQFQDLASQLIAHTHQRLRNCADQLARDAFGPDADGETSVAPPPLRPNPVTQDEMDAGSVELF